MADPSKFRFSIDRGGTFTDIYAEVPGEPGYQVLKLLSEDPRNYPDAPREGIRRIMEAVTGRQLPKERFSAAAIEWIRMGTTVATNALLERKGARSALVVTRGFRDILQIGNQSRPDIFDLQIKKPDLLYEAVIEADERLRIVKPNEKADQGEQVTGLTGETLSILKPLDLETLRPQLQQVYDAGVRSLAVALLHAYAWPGHEREIGRLAEEIGFTQISLSSVVMPQIKLVPRGDTTMVDAYLTPHITAYLKSFREGFSDSLHDRGLFFMRSDGGLTHAEGLTGSRAILSGPAGGVVGYAMTTYQAETGQPVIGFDMGGTSTDVSRYAGALELVFETRTAGVRIQAPQLQIKTVAAGGGSRLFFENAMFQVGPESAGAHPGPVCYRKNGYLTLTDANLVLGRIQPAYFPRIFGEDGDQPLDLAAARSAMEEITHRINAAYAERGGAPLSMEEVALGFIRVANEGMVRPIREVSVLAGYDVKAHILASFGGAGPQHACAVARSLGISRIFIHRFSGILSAYGMGLADIVVERQAPCAYPYTAKTSALVTARLDELKTEAVTALTHQGLAPEAIRIHEFLNLRFRGTDTPIMVERPGDGDDAAAFHRTYRRTYGFDFTDREILIDDIRVRATGKSGGHRKIPIARADGPAQPMAHVACYFDTGWRDTAVFQMDRLRAGHLIEGPALLLHQTATVLVEPECRGEITAFGDVEITVGGEPPPAAATGIDPVQLSIFCNLFMSIAEQMGRMLQKTAISTNIKERLDFSCALFDPQGDLVANAPHLPVHLGAMSEAVKSQIRRHGNALKPGDVLLSNHPAAGGSHLPDMTVMTPVFRHHDIIFWVASRGHHADIGGICPGSMPPDSTSIEEEGACIQSFKLVENGVFQEAGIRELLLSPGKGHRRRMPGSAKIRGTRALSDNLSDLKAQIAANQKGIELVLEMVDHFGLALVQAYMQHVQSAAEGAIRERMRQLSSANDMAPLDTVTAVDHLDDGSPIALSLAIDRDSGNVTFDFAGTGPQLWGNLNAPRAVTKSAILYCLRSLIQKDLPLNHGCLIPVTILIPEGCLLDPSQDAAVVGGNVLTSQRIVDVVLKAFGVAAASQGCMNNLTFGNARFGYYETIGGGAGAGPGWHGQSGVHTHMTNTRITDPEILERRYPVLLREFSIRRGSGGRGRFNGGDGLIRDIEFLDTLSVAILSERRAIAPYGRNGGAPGARGINLFIFTDGRTVNLGGKNKILASPGDRIRILTPGGGGFGAHGCPGKAHE